MRTQTIQLTGWRGCYPSTAAEVFLNVRQASGLLEVPVARVREAYLRGNIVPDHFDGLGAPQFALVRVHELAEATDAPGRRKAYAIRFDSALIEPVELRVDPPTGTKK